MLRRLIALLALLTGLFAAAVPAQASIGHMVGVAAEANQQADDNDSGTPVSCAERQRQQKLRGQRVTPCRPAETVTVFIPAIQLGVDRARE